MLTLAATLSVKTIHYLMEPSCQVCGVGSCSPLRPLWLLCPLCSPGWSNQALNIDPSVSKDLKDLQGNLLKVSESQTSPSKDLTKQIISEMLDLCKRSVFLAVNSLGPNS